MNECANKHPGDPTYTSTYATQHNRAGTMLQDHTHDQNNTTQQNTALIKILARYRYRSQINTLMDKKALPPTLLIKILAQI